MLILMFFSNKVETVNLTMVKTILTKYNAIISSISIQVFLHTPITMQKGPETHFPSIPFPHRKRKKENVSSFSFIRKYFKASLPQTKSEKKIEVQR